ncbi:MAG: D-2-hydroxyacid dehydrogenase [Erysipelotrichaceae bacterium]|nr:D-2-hydroxyacid dehydrogenase [Erysipelotrichaceae bacterium]
MKIVVLDGYTCNPGDTSWQKLQELGELTVYDRTSEDLLLERAKDAEILVTNKTPIGKETIDACEKLQMIAVLATGYNVVDTAYAHEKGIAVANVPAYGTEIVAQYAIALLLEITSQVGLHAQSVKAGEWSSSRDFAYWKTPLIELNGKTAGIIGLGRIGKATARICRALGMKVLAVSPHEDEEGKKLAEYVSLPELLKESDVIFLHCPLKEDNKGLINKDTIAKMKDGVILINNARGPLIVAEDLAAALNSGKVYAAGLDVAEQEPIAEDDPLLRARNCYITPHISWAAREARQRIIDMTAENIAAFQRGEDLHRV